VAEQGCLLSSYPGKTGIGGSNPPLSAINQYTPFHSGLREITLPAVSLKFRNDDSVCGRRSIRNQTINLARVFEELTYQEISSFRPSPVPWRSQPPSHFRLV